MSILVARAGPFTTLQGLGVPTMQDQGFPPGGAMDGYAARLCNILAANREDATLLEATLAGPALVAEAEVVVVLGGGDFDARVGGERVPLWTPVRLATGATLELGHAVTGCRAYIAFSGGIALWPDVPRAARTPRDAPLRLAGRPLRAGDRLPLGSAERPTPAGRPLARSLVPRVGDTVRFIAGTHRDALTHGSRAALLEAEFRVRPDSDRMGYRLEGPRLALGAPLELLSSGVTTGTVQLPPDGNPIVLMTDRQTTGGYPRLGQVATVDLGIVAQRRPGDTIRFAEVSLDDAQRLYLEREQQLRALRRALATTR